MGRWGLLLACMFFAASSAVARAGVSARYVATVSSPDGLTRVELLDDTGRPVRGLDSFGALNGNWEASWSPDTKRLAWIDPDGLFVARADGTHRKLLARSSGTMRYAWSPDSRSLAVSDGSRLFTVTVGGRHRTALERGSSGSYWVFGWTRAGVLATKLAGKPGTASCCSYSVIAAQAQRPSRLVYSYPDWHCDCSRPSLAPDGRRFAYFDDGRTRVVGVQTGTARLRGVTRQKVSGPFWSPTWTRVPLPSVPRGVHLLSLALR